MGFAEGQNVAIEYRWAERQYDRLPALATDLVRRRVALIVAAGTPQAALAAKAATAAIPIVFNIGTDPTELGLVASLNRPGGNATGTNMLVSELGAKRLELLHEMVPQARTVAYLRNPGGVSQRSTDDIAAAALPLGLQIQVLGARSERDFDQAFASLVQQKAAALVVSPDPTYLNQHEGLIALAALHRVPAIYAYREFPAAGGLISYGTSVSDAYRQLGVYAGRILKGEKPADLPVVQPTKFDLVINLKTAKTLGLAVPPTLLARADEVIE
jgi:putative ABC transport system substrate-binding protein